MLEYIEHEYLTHTIPTFSQLISDVDMICGILAKRHFRTPVATHSFQNCNLTKHDISGKYVYMKVQILNIITQKIRLSFSVNIDQINMFTGVATFVSLTDKKIAPRPNSRCSGEPILNERMIFPQHLNSNGTCFGGNLIKWAIDAIEVRFYPYYQLQSIENFIFICPVYMNSVVKFCIISENNDDNIKTVSVVGYSENLLNPDDTVICCRGLFKLFAIQRIARL